MTAFQANSQIGYPDFQNRLETFRCRNFGFPVRSIRCRFRFAKLGLAIDYKAPDGLYEPFVMVPLCNRADHYIFAL